MNQIVRSYMSKFVDDECGIYKDLPESQQFEHFMNHIIIKRDFLDDFDLDCIHTGGGQDNGIDGIAVIVNNELVSDIESAKGICKNNKKHLVDFIFIQSKTSDNLDNGDILKFFDGVLKLFEKDSHNTTNKEIAEFLKIKDILMRNSFAFSDNPKIYLKYAYNGVKGNSTEIDNNINNYRNRFNQLGLFSEIVIEILDSKDIQNMCKEIMLNVKKTITLDRISAIPQIEKVQESYIGLIPLAELMKLISDDNGRIIKSLFYDNVRDFQGYTTVNKEIIKTMRNEAESQYFGLYHNGITIVAKTLKKTGDSITLENFQIVNGCQTSHIIAENKKFIVGNRIDKMFIPIKLIATEDNNIINSVIKTTNRHNEVKREAFESLEEFHKGLEQFYNAKNITPKIYYERRNKQYIYDDQIKKYHIITLAEQIRTYLSMFGESPHSTHRYYGELLEASREKYKLFQKANNQEHFELYHIAGLTFIKFNALMASHKIWHRYKQFRYHILLIFKLIVVGNLSINSNKKDYENKCKKLYNILSDDNQLHSYINECCKIIDKAKGQANSYNLNRMSYFTSKIIDICKKTNDIHISKWRK